jgi:hypothetical protein
MWLTLIQGILFVLGSVVVLWISGFQFPIYLNGATIGWLRWITVRSTKR